MTINFLSQSIEDTNKIAARFAGGKICKLEKNCVVLLMGEVGAGKTTFVRCFSENYNLAQMVTSPTYTIVNEYDNHAFSIAHIDLYRLNSTEELQEIGLEDVIRRNDITFIEWPELSLPVLNFRTIQVQIQQGEDENIRKFIFGVADGKN